MRRLFNISTILSLLLLMATAALWVASGSVQKWAYTPDSGSATRMVVCSHGTLTVAQCGAPPAMAHWRVGSGGRSTGLIIYLVMPPPGFLKDRALLGIDVVRASNGWILPPDQVNQKDNLDPFVADSGNHDQLLAVGDTFVITANIVCGVLAAQAHLDQRRSLRLRLQPHRKRVGHLS